MHIKFLSYGTGEATRASAYVLSDRDHLGIIRAGVSVLRGNPEHVAAVADSLPFLHKYTSGVISWHPDDKPTPEQIEQTLDEFERVAFANLDPERYCWTAVLHTEDDGSVHIHVLIARVDLLTGKSLNIAPPGWQKDFDPLRDWLNHSYGWSRPDDPARARLVQPKHESLRSAAALRAGLTTKEPKEEITGWLTERIVAGVITDRQGIIQSLSELGEITRAGKDYVSVKPEGFEKAIRLKGAIYGEQFNSQQLVSAYPTESGIRPETGRGIDRRAVEDSHRKLEAAINRRADYNAKRYRRSATPVQPDSERPPKATGLDDFGAGEQEPSTVETPSAADSPAIPADIVPLPDRLRRQLGMVQAQPANRDSDGNERAEVGSHERQQLDDLPKFDTSTTMQTPQFIQQLKDFYDRTRNTTTQGINGIVRRIQQAFSRFAGSDRRLEQQIRTAESFTERIDEFTRKIDAATGSGGSGLSLLMKLKLKGREAPPPETKPKGS